MILLLILNLILTTIVLIKHYVGIDVQHLEDEDALDTLDDIRADLKVLLERVSGVSDKVGQSISMIGGNSVQIIEVKKDLTNRILSIHEELLAADRSAALYKDRLELMLSSNFSILLKKIQDKKFDGIIETDFTPILNKLVEFESHNAFVKNWLEIETGFNDDVKNDYISLLKGIDELKALIEAAEDAPKHFEVKK